MRDEIVKKLLALNKVFYSRFAVTFAQSRDNPQPGFIDLMDNLPQPCERVVDVGCGNGRFGQFLRIYLPEFDYTGIDFTADLLTLAAERVEGSFFERDICRPGFLDKLGNFDLIICLATMQHIPGRSNRLQLLLEMKKHLTPTGGIFLANWQFMSSLRQRRKIRDWELVGLNKNDVENGDYLLSWNREGSGLRYVCLIDTNDTAVLAEEAGLTIQNQFRSDGKEGNLNLYTVCVHAP
ncbi:MAG: methyltransferase domain-containing protein [Chloroflexi bacterium]|jgi:SAM-dependent methyltransferase|nr:methyltransferase domain-containing protein [Chloroflexota bacterium]